MADQPSNAHPHNVKPTSDVPVEEQSIGHRMKAECWDLHEIAEHGEIPAKMVKGELSRDEYTTLLIDGLHIHRALDTHIKNHFDSVPELRTMIDDDMLQTPYFEADLEHMGIDHTTAQPTEGVAAFVGMIEQTAAENPLNLLALHYVREGANNGNRYVAKKLRPNLGFEETDRAPGTLNLDPYGSNQRPKWDAFKVKLNELPLTHEQKNGLVATGRKMFQAMIDLHNTYTTAAV